MFNINSFLTSNELKTRQQRDFAKPFVSGVRIGEANVDGERVRRRRRRREVKREWRAISLCFVMLLSYGSG